MLWKTRLRPICWMALCHKGTRKLSAHTPLFARRTGSVEPIACQHIEHVSKTCGHSTRKGAADALASREKKLKLDTAAARERWWAQIPGDRSYIDALRPIGVGVGDVEQDDANGRCIVCYIGQRRRSVSCAARGMAEASKLVLKTVWGWHEEATGQRCPWVL